MKEWQIVQSSDDCSYKKDSGGYKYDSCDNKLNKEFMCKQENCPIASQPTIDEAGSIAVGLSEDLAAKEQAFFIAGFQECIKYLLSNTADAQPDVEADAEFPHQDCYYNGGCGCNNTRLDVNPRTD